MSTIDLFLDELKFQYKQGFELKSTLENKANFLLIASGVAVTLLFSFGSMLIDKIYSDYQYLIYGVIFLMIGVIGNGLSILFSVLAFSPKPYRFTLPYDIFYNDDGTFNYATIEKYRDGTVKDDGEAKKIFKESILENYLRCNKQNGQQNSKKAIKVKIAQWLFFVGSASIPFTLGFILPKLYSTPPSP